MRHLGVFLSISWGLLRRSWDYLSWSWALWNTQNCQDNLPEAATVKPWVANKSANLKTYPPHRVGSRILFFLHWNDSSFLLPTVRFELNFVKASPEAFPDLSIYFRNKYFLTADLALSMAFKCKDFKEHIWVSDPTLFRTSYRTLSEKHIKTPQRSWRTRHSK